MSQYIETLILSLRTRVSAVWTDVPANGIWEAEHATEFSWSDQTPPYAVFVFSLAQRSSWGMANLAYEFPLDLYYVAETQGPGSPIRAKLEALRDDLWANGALTGGQVYQVTDLNWGRGLLANQVLAKKNSLFRAGRLTLTCICGESP